MRLIVNRSKFILDKEIIRYGIVGVLTQVIDFVTYVALISLGVPYVAADLLNNPLSLGFNYFGHKFYTFKSEKSHKKDASKYIFNLIINYFYSTAVLIVATELISNDPIIGKIIQILAIPIINYLSLKVFVFRK